MGIKCYSKHKLNRRGELAVKLAREAIFGDDVLAQCTPGGSRELPALPNDELNPLKEGMFEQFSQYWSNPVEFEAVWSVCFNAVGRLMLSHTVPLHP